MGRTLAWVGQAALYGIFALIIGVFATWPPYRHLPPDEALIKLSFSHHGQPVSECRERSAEELAKLPPNMRVSRVCPRERSPVAVEIDLDGAPLYRDVIAPSGLSRDGASTVYRRFPVKAGEHDLAVRLKDSVRASGYTHVRSERVRLQPAQILVVDLSADKGGLFFQ